MKKYKSTFLAVIAASAMASCSFLDKEPMYVVPENYFTTETELMSALTGVYADLAQSTFYGNDYLTLAGGDDLTCYAGSSGRISKVGIICNNANSGDPATTALWFTLYNGIERANLLIEKLNVATGISDDRRAQIGAEARFLRAFYYFNLVQNWGDVPFKTKSTVSTESVNGKDIACTPKDEIYEFIVKEMAEVADKDNGGLKSAAQLNYRPGHVSKSAAWGVLARVYLFWAGEYRRDKVAEPEGNKDKYVKAAEYAKLVMGEGHELAEDYWRPFMDMCSDQYNTTANESIWEVEFAGDGTGDVRAEGRVGNANGLICKDFSSQSNLKGANDPGFSYGFLWSTPKLYQIYQENGDRERFLWNLAPFTYKSHSNERGIEARVFTFEDEYKEVMESYGEYSYYYGVKGQAEKNDNKLEQKGDLYINESGKVIAEDEIPMNLCCGKFRREYEKAAKKNKNFTAINFPVLRYSDVLLMLAEAENEVNEGPTELAKDCLKKVRERAGLKLPKNIESKVDFLNAIKNERAMELCFEYTRRYDLIRWGDYIKAMNDIVQMALSSKQKLFKFGQQVAPFFAIPESYNYLPIPDSERAVNKLITKNNPGW